MKRFNTFKNSFMLLFSSFVDNSTFQRGAGTLSDLYTNRFTDMMPVFVEHHGLVLLVVERAGSEEGKEYQQESPS